MTYQIEFYAGNSSHTLDGLRFSEVMLAVHEWIDAETLLWCFDQFEGKCEVPLDDTAGFVVSRG